MRKLVYMSLWLAPFVMAIRAGSDASPRRGLRRTVAWTFVFTVLWAVIGPWLVGSTE